MRRFLCFLRAAGTVLGCIACAVFALLLLHAPVFAGGEGYEVYYGDSSSCLIERTDEPLLTKLAGGVKGESARFAGDRYEELKARFHAELLFEEEACGVTNYYLYSPDLGGGVYLNGYLVNLHIATGKEETAAGTPLIFGGY